MIKLPIRCQICRARGEGVDPKVGAHWLCHYMKKAGKPTPRLKVNRFQNTKAKRQERWVEAVRGCGGGGVVLP